MCVGIPAQIGADDQSIQQELLLKLRERFHDGRLGRRQTELNENGQKDTGQETPSRTHRSLRRRATKSR